MQISLELYCTQTWVTIDANFFTCHRVALPNFSFLLNSCNCFPTHCACFSMVLIQNWFIYHNAISWHSLIIRCYIFQRPHFHRTMELYNTVDYKFSITTFLCGILTSRIKPAVQQITAVQLYSSTVLLILLIKYSRLACCTFLS